MISFYKSTNKNFGYNISPGGEDGYNELWNDETYRTAQIEERKRRWDDDDYRERHKKSMEKAMNNPSYKTCRDRYMLYIMIFCGLRNGEVRSLKLDSIKLDGSFQVTGKYSKTREVSLPAKLIKMHQEYIGWRNTVKSNSNCLFVSNHGNSLDQNVCNRLVKKYSEMVGLQSWTAHSTRKACVTTLIDSGIPVEAVANILGHVDYRTTLKSYYQQDKKVVKEDINKNKLLEII